MRMLGEVDGNFRVMLSGCE